MKDKILMICLFFLLMAAIPLCLIVQNRGTGSEKSPSGSVSSSDRLAARTAALCDRSFSDEAIKAVAVIQNTNAAAGVNDENITDDISDTELLERIKAILPSEPALLTFNGKAAFIPVSASSNGNTQGSEEYVYLEGVASPWDYFSASYDADAVCEGVSLNGIKILCEKGLSAQDALRYYLPKLEMTDSVTQ